jgi:hypothetical protein
MKTNAEHQKEAITTEQANRHVGEREAEHEKQKLKNEAADPRQQALERHPKDSEQH